jgi:hypothetical protein
MLLIEAIVEMAHILATRGDKNVSLFQVDNTLIDEESAANIYQFIVSEIRMAADRLGHGGGLREDPAWQAFVKGRCEQ